MMNKKKTVAAVLALVFSDLAASQTQASIASGGYVANLSVASNGYAWFAYTGSNSGLPSCADPNGLWELDPSQTGYQGLLSALLTAKAQHAQINIYGSGVCGSMTHETMGYITFTN